MKVVDSLEIEWGVVSLAPYLARPQATRLALIAGMCLIILDPERTGPALDLCVNAPTLDHQHFTELGDGPSV